MLFLIPALAALALAEPASVGCPDSVSEIEAPSQPERLKGSGVIVVFKESRRLGLYADGQRKGCWPVGLASTYVEGHKQRRGDMRTPEGWFRTSDKPWSNFYAAIAVHYPEAVDAERGVEQGLISTGQRDEILSALERGDKPPQNTRLGGEILIHGGGGSSDWTLGCVALDDADIDELRKGLPKSMRTDVLVLP